MNEHRVETEGEVSAKLQPRGHGAAGEGID